MNLFYKPSLSELARLIDQISQNSNKYNVVVDHDGEVLLDSNSKISTSLLNRFKFYFCGMTGSGQLKQDSENYLNFLNQLYTSLLFCWEQNIGGEIDFRLVSKIQNRNFIKRHKSNINGEYSTDIRK